MTYLEEYKFNHLSPQLLGVGVNRAADSRSTALLAWTVPAGPNVIISKYSPGRKWEPQRKSRNKRKRPRRTHYVTGLPELVQLSFRNFSTSTDKLVMNPIFVLLESDSKHANLSELVLQLQLNAVKFDKIAKKRAALCVYSYKTLCPPP